MSFQYSSETNGKIHATMEFSIDEIEITTNQYFHINPKLYKLHLHNLMDCKSTKRLQYFSVL